MGRMMSGRISVTSGGGRDGGDGRDGRDGREGRGGRGGGKGGKKDVPKVLVSGEEVEELASVKAAVEALDGRVMEVSRTMVKVMDTRDQYVHAALRGVALYSFLHEQVAPVLPSARMSLAVFLRLYEFAVHSAVRAVQPEKRVEHIVDALMEAVYGYVSQGMTVDERLHFALLLALNVDFEQGGVGVEEIRVLFEAGPEFLSGDSLKGGGRTINRVHSGDHLRQKGRPPPEGMGGGGGGEGGGGGGEGGGGAYAAGGDV